MKKRILITGSSGLLGPNLAFFMKDYFSVFGIDVRPACFTFMQTTRADLVNESEAAAALGTIKPHAIIHCAAMTNVDACEENPALAEKINVSVTQSLVRSVAPKTRFIYISTDSVFDGAGANYGEEDNPRPINVYAATKLKSEGIIKNQLKNYLIVRTNFFGWNMFEGQSFAEWIVSSLSSGKPLTMFTDVVFTPLYAQTLASLICELVEKEQEGILNLVSTTPISKYDFGVQLAAIFGLNSALITPCPLASFSFKAARPRNTSLNTQKAISIFKKLPTVEDEIKKLFLDKNKFKGLVNRKAGK